MEAWLIRNFIWWRDSQIKPHLSSHHHFYSLLILHSLQHFKSLTKVSQFFLFRVKQHFKTHFYCNMKLSLWDHLTHIPEQLSRVSLLPLPKISHVETTNRFSANVIHVRNCKPNQKCHTQSCFWLVVGGVIVIRNTFVANPTDEVG